MRIEDVIGRWITEGREVAGMTQEQLGERLAGLLGKPWPKQAVSSAEKGRRAFTAAELVAFSVVLGCRVENLLQPPIEAEHVTLSDGPPLHTSHLRTAVPTNTDLAELMTNMERLGEELVRTRTDAAGAEKSAKLAQMKLLAIYQSLDAALRDRGIAEQEDPLGGAQ